MALFYLQNYPHFCIGATYHWKSPNLASANAGLIAEHKSKFAMLQYQWHNYRSNLNQMLIKNLIHKIQLLQFQSKLSLLSVHQNIHTEKKTNLATKANQ